jgi:hypothetical protein
MNCQRRLAISAGTSATAEVGPRLSWNFGECAVALVPEIPVPFTNARTFHEGLAWSQVPRIRSYSATYSPTLRSQEKSCAIALAMIFCHSGFFAYHASAVPKPQVRPPSS